VGSAIGFDGQARLLGEEVDDEGPKWMLPTELYALELASPQLSPEHLKRHELRVVLPAPLSRPGEGPGVRARLLVLSVVRSRTTYSVCHHPHGLRPCPCPCPISPLSLSPSPWGTLRA